MTPLVAHRIAYVLYHLDLHFSTNMHDIENGMPSTKYMELQQEFYNLDSTRNLLRYFDKRTPCSCLDEPKKASKGVAKTGWCRVCKKRNLLAADMFTCSACGLVKYCSRECQRKDWEKHKEACKNLCSLKKQIDDLGGGGGGDKNPVRQQIA